MNVTALLNYRSQVEQALRSELRNMQGVLQEAIVLVGRLEEVAEKETRQYLQDAAQGLMADQVVGRQVELEALAERIKKARETVLEHQRRCDQKLAEVMTAAQERKKLDVLETRQRRREEAEAAREEQRDIDELAGRRFLTDQEKPTTNR
jgi:flagellar FliJ protein